MSNKGSNPRDDRPYGDALPTRVALLEQGLDNLAGDMEALKETARSHATRSDLANAVKIIEERYGPYRAIVRGAIISILAAVLAALLALVINNRGH